MGKEEENIGMCKKCYNMDYLSPENLCSKCSKHEPELKCCGEHLDIYKNEVQDVKDNKKLLFRQRMLLAKCKICGNDYKILFVEEE